MEARSIDPSTRRAFFAMSAVFAAVTIFMGVLFVRALQDREIRTGLFTYGAVCAAAAVGLARQRRWGRSVALVVMLGNIGLGALSLFAIIFAREGAFLGPLILLVASLILAYILSRPVFSLPDDYGAATDG